MSLRLARRGTLTPRRAAGPTVRPISVNPLLTLDADVLGAAGSAVSAWGGFTQSTVVRQPAVVAGPNGHKAVQFVDDILDNGNTGIGSAHKSATVTMVLSLPAVATVARSGILSCHGDYSLTGDDWNQGTGAFHLSNPASTAETSFTSLVAGGSVTNANDVNTKTSSQPFNQWVIVTVALGTDGVALQTYTNGAAETAIAGRSITPGLLLNVMRLGKRRYYDDLSTDYARFNLAALRIYPGRLSTADRSALHSNLSDAYGITVADYTAG